MNAVTFALLFLATYFDLRDRIIPDWLTKSAIVFGVVYHIFVGNYLVLAYVVGGFLFAYALYSLGLWAGGDVKLFTAFSALFPHSLSYFGLCLPAFLWLFLFSLLASLVLLVPYVLYSVFKSADLRLEFIKVSSFLAVRLIAFLALLRVFGLFAWMFVLMPLSVLLLSALASFLAYPSVDVLVQFLFVFPVSILFVLLPYRLVVFVREKNVSELKEGDVLADFVTDDAHIIPFTWQRAILHILGKFHARLSPLRAAGLERDDIEWLKRSGIERIRVKETTPFVPFVLAAYIFMLVFGISYCG